MKLKASVALMSGLCLSSAVALAEEANQINNIVVTAKTQSTVEEMPTAVSVITAADIRESGAASIQDVLAKVPGFTWTSNSSSLGGRKNIGLRGMDSEHVLILINGKRINSSDGFIGHSNFQISGVDLNSVQRVEVLKSAGTVLYGSNAMGGVINIITRDQEQRDYTNITASVSALDSRSGGDALDIGLAAGRALSDATYIELAANDSDRKSASTGGSVIIEGKKVQNTSIDLTHQITPDMSIGVDYSTGSEERRDSSRAEYDIDRSHRGLQFNAMLGNTAMEFNTYKQSTDAMYHSSSGNYTHRMTDDVTSVSFAPQAWGGHVANFGVDYQKSGYKKDYINPASSDYTAVGVSQTSLFAQDKMAFGAGDLTVGGRYDDNNQYGSQLSPEVGYSFAAGEGVRARINYARGFKAPNIKEADSNYESVHYYGGPTGSKQIGNSNLKPETSNSISLGLQSARNEGASWAVDLYTIRAKDFITSAATGATESYAGGTATLTVKQYQNLDKANINGLDVSFANDLSDSLFFSANLTFLNTDNGSGDDLAYRPDVTLKADLTKYFGDDQNVVWSVDHTGNSKNSSGAAVGSYTLHNLAYNKWLDNGVSVQFAVNNLTGELNETGNHMTQLPGREYKFTLSRSF